MKKKVLTWILLFCVVLTFFPAGALADEESGSSQVTLVSPSDHLASLHWTYKEGDSELTGLSDMQNLLVGESNLTAYDQDNNEYTLSVSWSYYGYKDASGTMHGNQDAADFVLQKGNTYYFMPVPDGTDKDKYSFSDITYFLARVDYFLDYDPGAAVPSSSEETTAGTPSPSPQEDIIPVANDALTEPIPQADVITVTNDTMTDANPHSVNLSGNTYSLTLDVDPTGFAGAPKLVVSVPKGITLSNYPTESNATLSSYIKSVGAQTETDGSTTLTYIFNSGISAVGFNIALLPTYKLKTGATCTVTATVYDGDTQTGTASDSITVAANPTLVNGAYWIPYENTDNQNVDLKAADYYYVKAYEHFYTSYSDHYDYDSLTITVPIPDNATPGYYNGDTFVALTPGDSYAFTNGTVTYYENLTFTTDYDATYGTAGQGHGLVYELTASHALTASYYQVFHMYDSAMGGIWFRFPGDTAAGIYTPGCSPRMVAQADGDSYTLMDYIRTDGLNCDTVSYNFRNYDINAYVYPLTSYGSESVNAGNNLMPLTDNQYFNSSLYNLTGSDLTNVQVEYSGGYSGSDVLPLSADIHCYKLVFLLSTSGPYPSTADVAYSYYDASAGEVKTDGHAFLTVSDNTLSLDDGDYFTCIRATYNRLETSPYNITVLQSAYCYNANNKDYNNATENCPVYSKILSATMDGQTYGGATWTSTGCSYFYPHTTLATTPYYMGLLGTSSGMDKGTQYSFYFYPAYYGAVKNLCVYFLLPSGYEFQSYTPPLSWNVTSSDYTISSRTVTVNSDTELGVSGCSYKVPSGTYTLYTIQYTDGADHTGLDNHIVNFTLGPTVDTAEVKTGVCVPAAIGMTTENAIFPFSTNSAYQLKDLLDFDSDGDTSETFARYSYCPTATQNAAKVITLSGSLTSSYESGSGTSKSYQYNSTGAYKFTVYNGLDSGNTAQDATISIAVPSTGTGIAAKLTGAPTLSGGFLSGAAITYSTDGGTTYSSTVSDWGSVTNVKIVTASDLALSSGEAAFVSLPFNTDYDASVSSTSTSSFTASMSYSLYKNGTLSSTPNTSAQVCTMKSAPVSVSGTIFKDYDSDGVQDPNEQNNGKYYYVSLYSGTYSSGVTGLTNITGALTSSAGSFSFTNNLYQPGTYTFQVSLASAETLNDYSTGWVRDGDYAYYTFTVGGSVTSVKESLPLTAPRTLILNYPSCYLYDNATKKLTATVLPALEGTEKVTYASSDPSVATVSADGTLTYVSDGNATITATVPGYGGGDDVTAICTVYASKSSYTVTLHAGDNVTLSTSGYALSSGAYTRSYTPGSYISLPASSGLTNDDPSCYFDGWYDNDSFTGSPVSSLSITDYGNKEYYAKWTRYEASYETAADTWVYGPLSAAFYNVYNGGTIKLLKDVTLNSAPTVSSKNITLKTDGTIRTLTLNYYIYISSGSLTIDDSNLTLNGNYYYSLYLAGTGTLHLKAGSVTGSSVFPIYDNTGTVDVSGGAVSSSGNYAIYNNAGTINISGGSVSSANNYAIYNSSGKVYLSGTPTVTGKSADLYETVKNTIFGNDGAAVPSYYSGNEIKLYCYWWPMALGDVVVSGVSGTGHFAALNTGDYTAKLTSGNLLIAKCDYSGTEASAPVMYNRTESSITLKPQTISGQTVEYACSATDDVPSSGWQTSTTFTGLDSGTTYYFFARVMETTYVLAGAASTGTSIATKTVLAAMVSIDDYTYGGTVPTPSVSSNPGGGTVTYYYSTENVSSGGRQWTGITPTTLDTGTYYLYAVIAETDGYTGCTTAAVQFTVGRADFISAVSMTNYTYGGTVSTPSVSSNPGSGTVTYYYSSEDTNSGGTEWTGITPTTLDAGAYYLYAVIGQAKNYDGYTTDAKEFTVSPKSVPVVWNGDTAAYTYDSTDQGSNIAAKYIDAGGNDVELIVTFTHSESTSAFQDAGTYTAAASMATVDGNYALTNTTKAVTMERAPITVTANNKIISYGDPAANASYTITNGASNALYGEDSFTGTAQYTYGDYTAGSNVNNYMITVSGLENPNYVIDFKTGTLTVEEASITDETPATQTAAYTGQSITIGTLPSGDTINHQILTVRYSADEGATYTLDTAPTFAGAGEYTVYYQLSAPNHTPVTGTVAFTVTQNTANTISGLTCGDIVYGGTPTPSITGANFGSAGVTYTYASSQNGTYEDWKATNAAGTWWVKATIAGTADYVGTTARSSFTVKNAVVNSPSLTDKSYTGGQQKADVPTSALYSVKDNAGGVNAGTYPVTLTLTDPANYRWSNTDSADLSLTYQIQKAGTNTISGLTCGDFTYGGKPIPSITGATFGAAEVTYTYANSQNGTYEDWKTTNAAGTRWVKATIAGTANYMGATACLSFTVKKAVVSAPSLTDKNYTGSQQKADVPASSLYSIKDNAGGVSAGTYPVTLTLTDPANYRWSNTDSTSLPLTFQIKKAEINVISGMTCADVAHGGMPAPTITDATYGAGTVIYTYSSSKDGVYGPWSKDNEPGTYWVKAVIPATDSYAEAVFTAHFTCEAAQTVVTNAEANGGETTASSQNGSLSVGVKNSSSRELWVTVSIQLGNKEVSSKMLTVAAGATGSVEFENLPAAFYNAVVQTGDYRDTKMLEVKTGEQSAASFTIGNLDHRTVVEVKDGSPDVAVDNLSSVFESTAMENSLGITQEDLNSGKPIEIRLIAENIKSVDETQKAALDKQSSNHTIGLYVDLSLYKTVGENTTRLVGVNELLEVAIPIPDEMKGRESTIVVYRIHEGQPQTITTKPNSDGEYLQIDGGYVILHVKNFSTYALGYRPVSFPWWLLLLLIPIAGGIYWHEKKKKQRVYANARG